MSDNDALQLLIERRLLDFETCALSLRRFQGRWQLSDSESRWVRGIEASGGTLFECVEAATALCRQHKLI